MEGTPMVLVPAVFRLVSSCPEVSVMCPVNRWSSSLTGFHHGEVVVLPESQAESFFAFGVTLICFGAVSLC